MLEGGCSHEQPEVRARHDFRADLMPVTANKMSGGQQLSGSNNLVVAGNQQENWAPASAISPDSSGRDQRLDQQRFRPLGKLVVGNLDRIADIDNVGN